LQPFKGGVGTKIVDKDGVEIDLQTGKLPNEERIRVKILEVTFLCLVEIAQYQAQVSEEFPQVE